eukprot:10875511-Ditylum_brightwellii.AAC.1
MKAKSEADARKVAEKRNKEIESQLHSIRHKMKAEKKNLPRIEVSGASDWFGSALADLEKKAEDFKEDLKASGRVKKNVSHEEVSGASD